MDTSVVASRWIRRFHPAPDAPVRLICLPHAGGSASYFFPVSRSLSPEVDVVAVQYAGRQDRRAERCVDSLDELADLVFTVLRPLADVPMAFFGHSMGASLAFEVARRFEADGVVLAGVVVSGRRAPSRHRDEQVHLLDDAGLIAEVTLLNGTASDLLEDDEVLRMVLPAIRADYKAAETYRYQPGATLHCPILALAGDNDPKASIDEVRAWGEHTAGEFELGIFPGGHFFIDSSASAVIEKLRARLVGAF